MPRMSTGHTELICPVFEDTWILRGEVGGRPLQLTLLRGSEGLLLLDTGCASDVEGLIVPAFEELKLSLSDLRWIVNTHCDVDHQGGNAGMKARAPSAILACGEADRETIVSPEAIMRRRYDAYREAHGIFYGEEARQWILKESGAEQPPDLTFAGGERLRLGEGRELEIVPLPGHSHGHLGVYDRANRALFAGDALHGSVYHGLDGSEALCPTYLYVPEYLRTADFVRELPLEIYVGCHWPVLRGRSAIVEFCDASRAFVVNAEGSILEALEAEPDGLTLRELCERCGPRLGNWPDAVHTELVFAFNGHMEDLQQRGLAEPVAGTSPVRYRSAQA